MNAGVRCIVCSLISVALSACGVDSANGAGDGSGSGGSSGATNDASTAGGASGSGGSSQASGGAGSGGLSGSGGGQNTGGSVDAGGAATDAGPDGSTGGTGAQLDAGSANSTEPNLLIAFIGDQGNDGNSDAVLNLIKNEGAVATVHNGDFDYANDPAAWNGRIDRILGANYPYFAIVGNHDAAAWDGSSGYQSYIQARHARVPGMDCAGDLGVKATCNFRGLYMVQSCVGTSELTGHGNCTKDSTEQVQYLRDSLAADDSIWSVCSWHKNQNDMQVGTKTDEVGWNAYIECMKAGAIVSTGHEHSYARTLTLTDVGNASSGHGATGAFDAVELFAGGNVVFVSGLGGAGIRDYSSTEHDDDTWWASYYAANAWVKNGVLQSGTGTFGALFIRFHVNGNPRRAQAYFKDVNGRVADEFVIDVRP